MFPGENAIQVLDYKKHYRSGAEHLLDPTYSVGWAYKAGSWPTTVIVDPQGNIAGRWLGVTDISNWSEAIKTLDNELAGVKTVKPKGTYCIGNKCIVRSKKDAFDSQPTMVVAGDGRIHLVFTREQNGSGNLYWQVLEKGKWSDPCRVTRSAADDYSPHICPDGEKAIRLVWCSDRDSSGKYDVWTKRFDGETWSAAQQVVKTDDDAARPRCVMDTAGNFWVTYYRWILWGPRRSRDREIFARYHDGKAWSPEIQVSPQDEPSYEDHADPAIAADRSGNVWIAWAWDTHPRAESWKYQPAFGSAIFTRQLRAGMVPSKPQLVGMRAKSIKAARENVNWAFLPEVYCLKNRTYFAFNSHLPGGEHSSTVTCFDSSKGFVTPILLGSNEDFICSPRLIADNEGRLFNIWSARGSDKYAVYLAGMEVSGNWSMERKILAGTNADFRSAVAAFDADNTLWLAVVRTVLGKSTVETRKITLP